MLARFIEYFFGSPRSPGWRKVQQEHLKKEPNCVICDGVEDLNVHHIEPFHIHPEKELDPNNLITLCNHNRCHYTFGHLMSWKSWNADVRADVALWHEKIKNRPGV